MHYPWVNEDVVILAFSFVAMCLTRTTVRNLLDSLYCFHFNMQMDVNAENPSDLPADKQATRQQNAIRMAFCWRAAICPLLSAYWELLPLEKK